MSRGIWSRNLVVLDSSDDARDTLALVYGSNNDRTERMLTARRLSVSVSVWPSCCDLQCATREIPEINCIRLISLISHDRLFETHTVSSRHLALNYIIIKLSKL